MTTPTLTPDDVAVAQSGIVLAAPVGSTAPTDVTTAWDPAFVQLGYLSEDGVTWDPSIDFEDIGVWQDINPVRSIPSKAAQTFQFQARETNPGTVGLYLPDATITSTATIATIEAPSSPGADFRMFGIEWYDGADVNRLIIPRGLVKARASMKLNRTSNQVYDMTVTAYANGTPNIYTWLTNHASMLSTT